MIFFANSFRQLLFAWSGALRLEWRMYRRARRLSHTQGQTHAIHLKRQNLSLVKLGLAPRSMLACRDVSSQGGGGAANFCLGQYPFEATYKVEKRRYLSSASRCAFEATYKVEKCSASLISPASIFEATYKVEKSLSKPTA